MATDDDPNAQIIEEFRANGGRLGGEFTGGSFLILHTVGAKTGRERLTPVAYLPGDDHQMYIVAAGLGDVGARRHPDWYRNLIARPEVTIEVGSETLPATATVVQGPRRAEVWDAVIKRIPHFAGFLDNPYREVPVVALTPRPRP